MLDPTVFNIIIHDKTTFTAVFNCVNEEGVVFDLTGYTVTAWARGGGTYLPGGELDLAPSITDATNGEITITKTADQTALLYPGAGLLPRWDMVVTKTSTDVSTKIVEGTLDVRETQTP